MPEPVLTEPAFGIEEVDGKAERDAEEEEEMEEVVLEKNKGLVEVVKKAGHVSGVPNGVEARVERWERSREGVVGRWWIDKRLRWNGEPLSPKKTVPLVLSLEPPVPPLALSPNDVVDIWCQGVRCPPVITTSSSVMNRPRGCLSFSECPTYATGQTATLELRADATITGSKTNTTSISIASTGTSEVCTNAAVGEVRLAHSFIQAWLTRLRTAQSFVNRARMERHFDD